MCRQRGGRVRSSARKKGASGVPFLFLTLSSATREGASRSGFGSLEGDKTGLKI